MKTKTMKCYHGTFTWFDDDMYVGKSLEAYGNFSEDEVEVFKQVLTKSDYAIEVGSNIGALTVPMAHLCEQVYAFEPQQQNYELLVKNLDDNGIINVEANMVAVGATSCRVKVPTLEQLGHHNYGQVVVGDGEDEVDQVALDDCHWPNPIKFIKIDVEGMEIAVLSGAEKLIKHFRPIIYVENDRAENASNLIGWLIDHGYRCYWHQPPLFYLDNPRGNKKNVFGRNIVSINMLCLPEEADIEMEGLGEAFDQRVTPDMYEREAAHWLRKSQRHPDDLELSFRAAHFFNLKGDGVTARQLIANNLAKDPAHFGTLHLQGLLDLQAGDFEKGWPAYELRYKMQNTAGFGYRDHAEPHWNGKPTIDTVLVWGEQGFGDSIMFVRFMDEVLKRAPNAILEVPSQLYELFEYSKIVPRGRLFRIGRTLPAYDRHCSLPSLPATMGLKHEREVKRKAYLRIDPLMVQGWRKHNTHVHIGLCHRGGAASERPHSRDIDKNLMEPLALKFGPFMDLVNSGQFVSFADTAAAISSLDLVLTVDTGVAHLSGALGVPTWLLLSTDPDWRWQRERHDSPWYPSMHVFRQSKFMDWSSVVDEVARELDRRHQMSEAAA